MEKFKICAFCDTLIDSGHVACKEHYSLYLEYQNEEWMHDLIEAQRKQYDIDIQEEVLRTGTPPKEKRFYRKLTADDKEQIQYYHQKGIGYFNIAKILGINPSGVEHYINRKINKKSTN